MKTNSLIRGAAACLLALSLTACDKAKTPVQEATDAAGAAANSAKDAATGMVDAAKDAVAKAGGPVGEAVAAAKKALDEKNYQGALDELKKLADVKLSPEQQKVVDGLKEQATKMMAGAAAGAGGAADAVKSVLPK
jgi:hypothetical protein